MSEKYYIPNGRGNRIELVLIDRETKGSVWVNGKRCKKAHVFFSTWESAKVRLIQNAAKDLLVARRVLELAQSHHGNVKGLKKPRGIDDEY